MDTNSVLANDLVALAAGTASTGIAPAAPTGGTRAITADAFVDTIGVGLHLGKTAATNPGNAYNSLENIKSDMAYLGIHHVRDTFSYSYYMDRVKDLGAMGVKFAVIMGTGNSVNYASEMARIKENVGIVASVEGPNEVDNWPAIFNGQTGYSAAIAEQKQLYADIKSDPALQHLPVLNATLARPDDNNAKLGDLSAHTDYANAHVYPTPDQTSARFLPYWIDKADNTAPGRPTIITEGGYSTVPSVSRASVSETAQAKYTLNFLLDAYKLGVPKTYLYELLDERLDTAGADREKHFGLFHYDNTPKEAAVALHNLTTLLADGPAGFTPGALSYNLSGLPATANQLLLQKADGHFVLAVWNESDIWDEANRRDQPGADVPVTLTLGQGVAGIKVFDPIRGVSPVQTQGASQSLKFALPDHPLLIDITPMSRPQIL